VRARQREFLDLLGQTNSQEAYVQIAQKLIDEMVAHAREDLPNECCGMVGGMGGVATKVVRVANAAASPLRYEMDPQGQFDALAEIEADGELLAIYHSHTKSAAYPSQTDVNQAQNWPEPIYVIVSLADNESPDVKGFHLADLKVADAELEIG
jgi:[CysO sulfur-carrier protein]-S-L-cysteine hydrolase